MQPIRLSRKEYSNKSRTYIGQIAIWNLKGHQNWSKVNLRSFKCMNLILQFWNDILLQIWNHIWIFQSVMMNFSMKIVLFALSVFRKESKSVQIALWSGVKASAKSRKRSSIGKLELSKEVKVVINQNDFSKGSSFETFSLIKGVDDRRKGYEILSKEFYSLSRT